MQHIKHQTLENGLQIATDKMNNIETVSVNVWVKTGARYENIQNNGISHFLEHMAFKGTKTRSARDIAEEFDAIGGHFNAYTSRERTVFYAKVLKENVETAVDILADILQNSTLETEEIEKERGVILQEIAQTNDTPDDIIFDHFQSAAFHNQPLGRPILGTEELVRKFNKDDLGDYIRTHYHGKKMFLTAAGNIENEKFFDLANKYFSKLGNNANNEKEQASYNGGDVRINKDLEQVHMILGFPGLSYHDDNYYTQQISAMVLGGGMSSRLFQEVREKRGLAYTISAFGSGYEDCGIFSIYSGTSKTQANELISVVCDELQKATTQITLNELERAKSQVKAGILMSMESSSARAEKLGSNYSTFGRYIPKEEILEKINKISEADIQNFIKNTITKSQPTFASIGNVENVTDYNKIKKLLVS